ncbi:MAG: hypothetical protein KAQ97_00855 [Candidatus Fermentibacteraceae bacterium]|nr:hypothetical protein [Candidatus Fermentibacteraceae bacterium]
MIHALIVATLISSAGPGGFELGVILGEPTGVSMKLWLDGSTAVDGAVSWSLRDKGEDKVHLHADYLWHNFDLINDESGLLPLYYGFGGRIILKDETSLGFRAPLGISWLLSKTPLDLFVEIAGIIDIIPETDFDLNAGIGIRYVF